MLDNWYTLNSCDYYNLVCNSATYNSPINNVFGNQVVKDANAIVGAILFVANYETKEYFYQQLSTPLQTGHVYCLSFYVSRADRITHAIHSIGAYFSNTVQSAASLGYINKTPQVINQNGFITDTIGWQQIQGCFTANGGEQYLTIGNFNSNPNTDTLYVGSNNPAVGADRYAYYYIDDISLVENTNVGIVEQNEQSDFVNVYPNPASEMLNIDYLLFDSAQSAKFDVVIINELGQSVYATTLNNKHSKTNIQQLQSGIYFYHIKQKGVTVKQSKLIIIK